MTSGLWRSDAPAAHSRGTADDTGAVYSLQFKKGGIFTMKRTFKVKINDTEYIAEVEELTSDENSTEQNEHKEKSTDKNPNGEREVSHSADML